MISISITITNRFLLSLHVINVIHIIDRTQIFPRLMEFKADMIFISAGFDAHKKDLINSGYISLVSTLYFVYNIDLVPYVVQCDDMF